MYRFAIASSLLIIMSACSREHIGSTRQAIGGAGTGGAIVDPCAAPLCLHEIGLTSWCVSCLVDGVCADGDAFPRAGCGESCDSFGGPGGTAIDVSCGDGLWCSRCSGECMPLPRDCGC